jgi:signal transduction histidine kinase
MMESYPGPLGQILINLINNALLHAFDGRQNGKITIAAEALKDSTIRLTVTDDGIGIPTSNLNRVFDPFFTTKLGFGGSGLGLNITYNLIQELLGGDIHVTSTEGQGTCFTLTLPLRAPSPPTVAQSSLT